MLNKLKEKWESNYYTIIILNVFSLALIGGYTEKNKINVTIMIITTLIYIILIFDSLIRFDKNHKGFSILYLLALFNFGVKYLIVRIDILDKTFIDNYSRYCRIRKVDRNLYYTGLLVLLRSTCIQFINYIKSAYKTKDIEKDKDEI